MSVATQNMLTPVSATSTYREALAQIDRERAGKALADPALATAYAAELAEGFQYLATVEAKVEGQKALHGAYVYGMLSTTAVKGKVIVDGVKVALGQVVGQYLGRWQGQYNTDGSKRIEPLASGSVTRYRYISILVFDADFSPEDPEWSDLVNYYVSTPAMAALLKQHRDPGHKDGARKITREEVLAVIEILRTPPKAIEPPKADDSQGPENGEGEGENGAEVGGSVEDSTPQGASTDDNREARPNGEGAHLSENGARLERILSDLAAMTVPDADDCAALFAVQASVRSILEGALEVDRLEGRATFERLSK